MSIFVSIKKCRDNQVFWLKMKATMKTKAKENRVLTEEEHIYKGINKSGGDAYLSALSNGVAVTVLQEDKIQRIYPDGRKEVIGQIIKKKQKTIATRFRLK